MKIKLTIGPVDKPDISWVENFDIGTNSEETAGGWADQLIAKFNKHLRGGESARRLIKFEVVE